MAYDAFMWLKGGAPEAAGETTDKTFKADKAFEIYSFSWGASNPTTIGSATAGAGGGKVSISSFNIMKKTDSASPSLFLNCAKGQHFTEAHVRLRKAGGTALVATVKQHFDTQASLIVAQVARVFAGQRPTATQLYAPASLITR